MTRNILIAGATGLVGNRLIEALKSHGHQVAILSRRPVHIQHVKVFLWDIDRQTIDQNALEHIDTIINLTGEGIADKKWTAERKQKIIDSRIKSAELLYKAVAQTNAKVHTYISASAVGLYGDRGDEILEEESAPGQGFLADCCIKWENAADKGLTLGIRVVKIRIGIVLSKEGGALAAIEKPIKYFVGAPLGSGKQWIPWIHLDDIAGIFRKAVEDTEMAGAYHAVAPSIVTNKTLTQTLAKVLHRPVWPFSVPKSVLKILLGEQYILPLMSTNASAQKILDTGYSFKYLNLEEALRAIYRN
jgi:uncharacterized protein